MPSTPDTIQKPASPKAAGPRRTGFLRTPARVWRDPEAPLNRPAEPLHLARPHLGAHSTDSTK